MFQPKPHSEAKRATNTVIITILFLFFLVYRQTELCHSDWVAPLWSWESYGFYISLQLLMTWVELATTSTSSTLNQLWMFSNFYAMLRGILNLFFWLFLGIIIIYSLSKPLWLFTGVVTIPKFQWSILIPSKIWPFPLLIFGTIAKTIRKVNDNYKVSSTLTKHWHVAFTDLFWHQFLFVPSFAMVITINYDIWI